nr:hypothetical protein [Tanacetum cinerariifolium]
MGVLGRVEWYCSGMVRVHRNGVGRDRSYENNKKNIDDEEKLERERKQKQKDILTRKKKENLQNLHYEPTKPTPFTLRGEGCLYKRKKGNPRPVGLYMDTVIDDQEDVSKQREIIANIDADEDVTLKDVADDKVEENADDDDSKPAKLKEVVEVVTTAKLMTEVVTATVATITAATTPIIAAIITAAPSAARRIKRVVIRDPEKTATSSNIIHSEPKSKDKGKGIMVQEPKPLKKKAQIEEKEDNAVLRYQALKRKPQTEAQARNNIMIYLRNMDGFKMDYFKGMSYDDICPIFEKYFNSNVAFLEKTKEQLEEEESRVLKRISESLEEKATKKQKLDEEVEELKKHLQIVPNDDDDVYTEATPLALKVPIVDYEIYSENNKPYYKIIRADEPHQLFLSFLSLLRNFDREELEVL